MSTSSLDCCANENEIIPRYRVRVCVCDHHCTILRLSNSLENPRLSLICFAFSDEYLNTSFSTFTFLYYDRGFLGLLITTASVGPKFIQDSVVIFNPQMKGGLCSGASIFHATTLLKPLTWLLTWASFL